jgi:hypothetical protein
MWCHLRSRIAFHRIFLALLAGFTTLSAQAESDPKFEIWTGSFGHVSVTSMSGTINTQISVLGSSLGTGLLVGVPNISLGYHLGNGFELILTPSLNTLIPTAGSNGQVSDGTTIVSRFTVGAAYYFSKSTTDSFFLRLDSGIAFFRSGGLSSTTYVGSIQFGKKVPLSKDISWSPTFMYELMTTTPYLSMGLNIVPLQLSLYF